MLRCKVKEIMIEKMCKVIQDISRKRGNTFSMWLKIMLAFGLWITGFGLIIDLGVGQASGGKGRTKTSLQIISLKPLIYHYFCNVNLAFLQGAAS